MNVGFTASVMWLRGKTVGSLLLAVMWFCMVPTVLGQDVTVSKKGYEHRIVPGDRLRISVAEDKTLAKVYSVAGDGTIDMDYIGRVGVGDMTAGAAAEKIELLHPRGYDYFRILREKLHWGRDHHSAARPDG